MIFREYHKDRDRDAIVRIWLECGWIEDEKKDKLALDYFTSGSNCQVIETDGSAECLIILSSGKMKFGPKDLTLAAISSVTVSRILRKQGATPKLMASMIRDEIKKGTTIAGLGMFEQGFYNRLGFATMAYENWYSFDPAKLKIYKKGQPPVRITNEDYSDAFQCYSHASKHQGFVSLDPPGLFRAEMMWTKHGFGLGYKKNGKLSHYLWMGTEDSEKGPYTVHWMAYSSWNQFLELMGIIKSLEEQVRTIRMKEPVYIQLQDFIEKPFQLQTITKDSQFESSIKAAAYQQLRICNLESAIGAVTYKGKPFSFNITLSDPINNYLDNEDTILNCQGDFTISIGEKSNIVRGHNNDLPLVKGTINGFSRLWIGVLPARTIGLVEDIQIDPSLIQKLERAFYNRDVRSGWDY